MNKQKNYLFAVIQRLHTGWQCLCVGPNRNLTALLLWAIDVLFATVLLASVLAVVSNQMHKK